MVAERSSLIGGIVQQEDKFVMRVSIELVVYKFLIFIFSSLSFSLSTTLLNFVFFLSVHENIYPWRGQLGNCAWDPSGEEWVRCSDMGICCRTGQNNAGDQSMPLVAQWSFTRNRLCLFGYATDPCGERGNFHRGAFR